MMALIFGDKLNSDKLEFGLTLGNSFSTQTNFDDSKWRLRGWNVGLFFNVKLSETWYLHLAAIPKSTLGFRYLPTYRTGNPDINAVLDSFNFEVERKVNYIHVPLTARYRLLNLDRGKSKQSFYIQGGPVISLRTKAQDIFEAELEDDDKFIYENDLRQNIRRFDVCIQAGLVWKFKKLIELSVSYNQGFLDIDKDDATDTNRNQFVMMNVNIPMGGKKKEKAPEGTETEAPKTKEKKSKKSKE